MARVSGLGHVGLYVRHMPTMVEFFQDVLGMTLTDRDGDRIVFFSARPDEEHHEIALVESADRTTDAQQISFTVDSLADLRELYQRVVERGLEIDRTVNHGIAFGCYFRDPEGHRIELYWSTGIDYPQPHADPVDLTASEAELMALLESLPPRERAAPAS